MKVISYTLLAFFGFISLASAQEQGMLTRAYLVEPKAGKSLEFEEAVKQHVEWLGEHGESWEWSVHQVIVGQRIGAYAFVSHGHKWGDFDKAGPHRRKSAEQWQKHVAPYVEEMESKIYQFNANLSRLDGMPETVRYLMVTDFNLKPLSQKPFLECFAKITEAVGAQDSVPPVAIFRLVSGGEPQIKFVHVLASWEDAGRKEAAVQAAAATLGSEAREIADELRAMTVDIKTAVLMRRPDLSFKPGDSAVASQ